MKNRYTLQRIQRSDIDPALDEIATRETLESMMVEAEHSARRELLWEWFTDLGEWPLWASPDAGNYFYMIYGPEVTE